MKTQLQKRGPEFLNTLLIYEKVPKETKTAAQLNEEIIKQGDVVRNLKAQKVEKNQIDGAVKLLLALKSEYKAVSNTEWKPGCAPPVSEPMPIISSTIEVFSVGDLNNKIVAQGDKVRQLKGDKSANKSVVNAEVQILLGLKAEYKKITGNNWMPQPTSVPQATDNTKKDSQTSIANNSDENAILLKITEQGDKVRDLKFKKTEKSVIDAEVKILLTLKADYKALTGKEWKPGNAASVSSIPPPVEASDCSMADSNEIDEIVTKINNQGNIVRTLKGNKASKNEVDAAIKVLLDLKSEYKKITGTDFPVAGRTPSI